LSAPSVAPRELSAADRSEIAFSVIWFGTFATITAAAIYVVLRDRLRPWVFNLASRTIKRGSRTWSLDAVASITLSLAGKRPKSGATLKLTFADARVRPVRVITVSASRHVSHPQASQQTRAIAAAISTFASIDVVDRIATGGSR
jgi:hypothetical protein